MDIASKLKISGQPFSIDWEITPTYTFTMFESWGGRNGERVRNNDEKFYYFYVDGWEKPFGLFLMERGVKHARVMARIKAPQELIDQCVADEGRSLTLDKNYAINRAMQEWLMVNIIDGRDSDLIEPLISGEERESLKTSLPGPDTVPDDLLRREIRASPVHISDGELTMTLKKNGLFDTQRAPEGSCEGFLVDNHDGLTVTDLSSGLMWQRGGCDLTNIQKVKKFIAGMNKQNFAGFDNWRLPTIDEALSLLQREKNSKDLYLDPCFSRDQPFIFTADQRTPGGYWFVDFKQGSAFWASGTIPGGFGRACRSV